jgi:hypothetical protein
MKATIGAVSTSHSVMVHVTTLVQVILSDPYYLDPDMVLHQDYIRDRLLEGRYNRLNAC